MVSVSSRKQRISSLAATAGVNGPRPVAHPAGIWRDALACAVVSGCGVKTARKPVTHSGVVARRGISAQGHHGVREKVENGRRIGVARQGRALRVLPARQLRRALGVLESVGFT
jgi:hypothetical protein